jgi:amidase
MTRHDSAKDMEQDGSSGVSRRAFLVAGAIGPALAVAAGAAGCRVAEAPGPDEARRSGEGRTRTAGERFELEEVSIASLQAGLEFGRWTSRALVERYLARIQDVDRKGPTLRSIIEVDPEAVALADALDAERRAGRKRGPLHGVPILVKDNLDTADRMPTSAGSLALAASIAQRDAAVVARLREAGAIILGKANLSEWANFRSTRSSSGWSARGGQCRNPYVLDRSPCGSSSGTAAAVAANLAAAGIGTETDGSIVCPSSACGLVGIKPTVGLASRRGIIPIAASQDTAGPMARTVTDAVLLLEAIAGVDPEDPATAAATGHARNYTASLEPGGLKGARIGVARAFFGFNPAVDALMEEALRVLKAEGATLVDPVDLEAPPELDEAELTVLLHEFKAGLNAYLASLGPAVAVRTLADLIAFNEREAAREMPYFGQELFIRAEATKGLDAPEYRKALATCRRLARDEGIDRVVARHRLDAIVAPTGGPAWTIDLLNGDHFTGGSSTPAAVAGYPAITVPAGFVHGLPVGMSFFGRAWSEPTLIRLAFGFEEATRHRRPPRFLETLPLDTST